MNWLNQFIHINLGLLKTLILRFSEIYPSLLLSYNFDIIKVTLDVHVVEEAEIIFQSLKELYRL